MSTETLGARLIDVKLSPMSAKASSSCNDTGSRAARRNANEPNGTERLPTAMSAPMTPGERTPNVSVSRKLNWICSVKNMTPPKTAIAHIGSRVDQGKRVIVRADVASRDAAECAGSHVHSESPKT